MIGLSNGILLAQHNNVCFLDVDQNKVDRLNQKQSPIKDEYIDKYLKEKNIII